MSKKSNITLNLLLPDDNYIGINSDNKNKNKNGKININTLYSSITNVNSNSDYIGKSLVKSIERSRKKRLYVMLMCYNDCCRKIKQADINGDNYIFFDVPQSVNGCPKYNPKIITNYISDNLRNKCLDTIIINKGKTIYINWEHLEINIENN
jgi:hypothetical protein